MTQRINKNSFILFVPGLCWVLFQIFVKGLYYKTVDDLVIQDIVRGAFTGGAWDGVFISPLLCMPLSLIYSLVPGINWLGLFYVSVMLFSMIISDLFFYRACDKDLKFTALSSLVLFICWYQMWLSFSFTIVAYGAVITGTIMVFAALNEGQTPTWYIAVGSILLILGSLIRVDVLVSIALVLLPMALYSLLRNRFWRDIFFIGLLIVLYLGITLAGRLRVSLSETEKSYHSWNSVRSEIGDFMKPEDVMRTGVWDEDETKCFFEQIQYDKDIYNEEQGELIVAASHDQNMESRIADMIHNLVDIFSELRHPRRYENIYWIMLIVMAVVLCLLRGRLDISAVVVFTGFLITIVAFAWIGRYLYRTMMPGGVFTAYLLLYFCMDSARRRIGHDGSVYLGIIVSVGILLLTITTYIPYQRDRASQFDRANLAAIDYFAVHQDKVYLAAQSEAFGIANCVPVLETPSYNKANLIGNWNMYSESYYAITDSYGINDPDHLVKSIPDSENIRLIARSDDGVPAHFINFIESHSDVADVSTQLEDTFHTVWMGDWGVYKVVSAK